MDEIHYMEFAQMRKMRQAFGRTKYNTFYFKKHIFTFRTHRS